VAIKRAIALLLLAAAALCAQVSYHGGPVLNSPITVYLVWYGTPDSTFKTQMENFISLVGASPNFKVITQYAAADGLPVTGQVSFGGSLVLPETYGPTPNGPQYQQILQSALLTYPLIKTGAVSAGVALTTSSYYIVFAGPGVSFGGVEGAHGAYIDQITGLYIWQAEINSLSATIVFHELAESLADPVNVNGGGWFGGGEVADLCQGGTPGNLTLGAYTYSLQPLWSNIDSACVLALPSPLLSNLRPSARSRGTVRTRGTTRNR